MVDNLGSTAFAHETENWNGTNWTEVLIDLNTARNSVGINSGVKHLAWLQVELGSLGLQLQQKSFDGV